MSDLPAESNRRAATRSGARRFWVGLLVIVVVGLGVRVSYVTWGKSGDCPNARFGNIHTECPVGDQIFYNAAANRLALGDGFVEPFDTSADPMPAADHPPLTVIVLAPVSWLGHHGVFDWLDDSTNLRAQRYEMAVLGSVLVLLIGLLGRSVGRNWGGWIAAALAALYPNLWVNDGLVMSETVTGITVATALLLAIAFVKRPRWQTALALGVACGFAALAPAELILFVPLLAIPVTLLAREATRGTRLRFAAFAAVAGAVVVAPWVGYNLSRFEEPTLVSTNDGIALLGSNCDGAYYGSSIGLTLVQPPRSCLPDVPPAGDQSQVAREYRADAFRYLRNHTSRLPLVAAARVGRTWGVYRPNDMLFYNQGEGRERAVSKAGMFWYYPMLALSLVGAVVLFRRKERLQLWALLVPAIVVTTGALVTYGQVRFRAAAEPSIVVLAAVTLTLLVPRRGPAEDEPTPSDSPWEAPADGPLDSRVPASGGEATGDAPPSESTRPPAARDEDVHAP